MVIRQQIKDAIRIFSSFGCARIIRIAFASDRAALVMALILWAVKTVQVVAG